jgi:hypothetical protein
MAEGKTDDSEINGNKHSELIFMVCDSHSLFWWGMTCLVFVYTKQVNAEQKRLSYARALLISFIYKGLANLAEIMSSFLSFLVSVGMTTSNGQ